MIRQNLIYMVFRLKCRQVGSKEELIGRSFTLTHKISCLIFVFTIGMLLVGTIQLKWYIDEIATLFIIMTIITGLISRYTPSRICDFFIESSKEMMYGAL